MERLPIHKDSRIKPLVLNGLEASGYALVERTNHRPEPLYIYFNDASGEVAVYLTRRLDDELILIEGNRPGNSMSWPGNCTPSISLICTGLQTFWRKSHQKAAPGN